MLLDRQAQEVLDYFSSLAPAGGGALTPAQMREQYKRSRAALQSPAPEVAHAADVTIEGAGGPLALRHYRAIGTQHDELLPGIVYFHGGGWTTGDLDTHDVICRTLANALRGVVVAVDYRLAPEHKFPAALEDAITATQWVADNALRLSVDARSLAVAGDSAGGNLAAALALHARDAGGPALRAQALIYPALDFRAKHASHREFASGYLLTAEAIRGAMQAYLTSDTQVMDWRASPLLAADVSGLPATYVITAGFDPLRDEGEAYAERLHAAGVPVTYECFEGMIHGFLQMGARVAAAGHAIHRLGQGLRVAFGLSRSPGQPR